MTQVGRVASAGGVGKRRTNAAANASEWAAKRQAKIEAANAKKQAKEHGEVTEHHTFRPQTGRAPVSGRTRAATAATARMVSRECSNDVQLRSQEHSNTFDDLEYEAAPEDTSGRLRVRRAASRGHERAPVMGHEASRSSSAPRRLGGVSIDVASAAAVAAAAASGCSPGSGDDPWLHAGAQGVGASLTTTTGGSLSAFLSSESLSLASSHALLESFASTSARDGLLASNSQQLPLEEGADYVEMDGQEYPCLDEPASFCADPQAPASDARASTLPGTSVFLATTPPAESPLTEPVEPPMCNIKPRAAPSSLSGQGHESTRRSLGRRRAEWEDRELRNGPDCAAECVVATMEFLRESNQRRDFDGGDSLPQEPARQTSFSWWDLAADAAAQPPRLGGGSSSSSSSFDGRLPAPSGARLTMGALRRQEAVLDGVRIGERLVNCGDGLFSMYDLEPFMRGSDHEDFFFWLTKCSRLARSALVEMTLSDLEAALGDYYLRNAQDQPEAPSCHPGQLAPPIPTMLLGSQQALRHLQQRVVERAVAVNEKLTPRAPEAPSSPASSPSHSPRTSLTKSGLDGRGLCIGGGASSSQAPREGFDVGEVEARERVGLTPRRNFLAEAEARGSGSLTPRRVLADADGQCSLTPRGTRLSPGGLPPRGPSLTPRGGQASSSAEAETRNTVQERLSSTTPPPSIVCPGQGTPRLASSPCLRVVKAVPGREAPLRREEVLPDGAAQPLRKAQCIPSPQALGRQELHASPSCAVASSASTPSPRQTHQVAATDIPVEDAADALSPRSAVALSPRSVATEEVRQRWRREKVESLERKCQELEQQLGLAKEAKVVLRQELLSQQSTEPEVRRSPRPQPQILCHERMPAQRWPPGPSFEALVSSMDQLSPRLQELSPRLQEPPPQPPPQHALAREISAHTASHDALGLPGLAAIASSVVARRSSGSAPGSARSALSPVIEEPTHEESDAGGSEESLDAEVRLVTREDAPSSLLEQKVWPMQVDTEEMHKLVDMCDRLRTDGVSLPKAEIDNLGLLVSRLSTLVEGRRSQHPGSPSDSFTAAEALHRAPSPPLAGPEFFQSAAARRAAVPKLRGMPSSGVSVPSPAKADYQEDTTLPSPRDLPVLR